LQAATIGLLGLLVGIVYQMRMTALEEKILMESYRDPGMAPTTPTVPSRVVAGPA